VLKHVNSKFEENDKADIYKDYHKVYFISEDAQGLYGLALDIPSKSAVIFEVGFGDSTVAHELLHAMGLYHSFDDDGDFSMEYHLTDNIMDYSDMNEPPLPLINVVSTWHWQWPIIRKNLNKEK
jgi:hypothetical protein